MREAVISGDDPLLASDVKSPNDAIRAVRLLIELREKDLVTIAALQGQILSLEKKQGFFANRPKIKVPPFPAILRKYGVKSANKEGST